MTDANTNKLTLKWGTVKGWDLHSEEAISVLQRWADFGTCPSAMAHRDSPEQQQALLDAINYIGEIWLEWESRRISREEAKEYILSYR